MHLVVKAFLMFVMGKAKCGFFVIDTDLRVEGYE